MTTTPAPKFEISPRIKVPSLFPEMPEATKELLVEILEIRDQIAGRGARVSSDGSIDTTVYPQRKRWQEVGLVVGLQINDATTEDGLNLETTEWHKTNGLWAVQRESEFIGISSQKFKANLGQAIRDRFSVARVTTTGRQIPVIGFGVGSMRHLISNSMPIDAPNITTHHEIGPTKLDIETFDEQNLIMLLERFRKRLGNAL